MKFVEHIGIAVSDLEESIRIYTRLLNVPCYKTEEVSSEKVKTAFFQAGEQKIELLEASADDSPIASFITKKGPGIHHIAFGVTNIYEEIDRLKKEGFIPIGDGPKQGADNKLVWFLHPKSTGGVLIELCQNIS